MPTARSPGASSSSTRDSTGTPAGCTPPPAPTWSTSSPKPSCTRTASCSIATAKTCARSRRADHRARTRADDGSMATRTFTAYFTHHGPIVRKADGKWIAMALMNTPIPALEQSWLRTKTHDYASYMKVAEAQGQFVQQHDLRRRQGRDRLPASAVRPETRRPLRLHQAGGRQRSGHRLAGPDAAGPGAARGRIRPTAGSSTPTTGPIRPPANTAPSAPISRATWIRSAKTRAASTPRACSPARSDFTMPKLITTASIRTCRHSRG